MTQDSAVRDQAQKALDFIAAAQEPGVGGWRYVPQVGSDTSVSGWQMMALKSGELAGLEVASSVYPLVARWLDDYVRARPDAALHTSSHGVPRRGARGAERP